MGRGIFWLWHPSAQSRSSTVQECDRSNTEKQIGVRKACSVILSFVCIYTLFIYCSYKGPDRHKLYGPILEELYTKYVSEQREFFKKKSGYGRAITGDGATVMGTKFINFLCYELGKGSMLCRIRDCTKRLEEVGTVEATYIAHEMIASVRLISACTNYYFFLMWVMLIIQIGWSRICVVNHHWRGRRLESLWAYDQVQMELDLLPLLHRPRLFKDRQVHMSDRWGKIFHLHVCTQWFFRNFQYALRLQ